MRSTDCTLHRVIGWTRPVTESKNINCTQFRKHARVSFRWYEATYNDLKNINCTQFRKHARVSFRWYEATYNALTSIIHYSYPVGLRLQDILLLGVVNEICSRLRKMLRIGSRFRNVSISSRVVGIVFSFCYVVNDVVI